MAQVKIESSIDWLREVQQGFVPKSKEELKAELERMNFSQLRTRAGPPPTVNGTDFYNPADGEGNSGGGTCANFDYSISMFKKGLCPPPEPLYHQEQMSDFVGTSGKNVKAYKRWYSEWGIRLTNQWAKEHKEYILPSKSMKKVVPEKVQEKPNTKINRVVPEVVSEQSGW